MFVSDCGLSLHSCGRVSSQWRDPSEPLIEAVLEQTDAGARQTAREVDASDFSFPADIRGTHAKQIAPKVEQLSPEAQVKETEGSPIESSAASPLEETENPSTFPEPLEHVCIDDEEAKSTQISGVLDPATSTGILLPHNVNNSHAMDRGVSTTANCAPILTEGE